MSIEYIKSIIIKQDGVYLCSKSNNDDLPYRSWRCNGLSEIFQHYGQHGLDKEIIKMFRNYAIPKGKSLSLAPYVYATTSPEANGLITRKQQEVDKAFSALGDEDKQCISKWYALRDSERTAAAKAFKKAEATAEEALCDALAELAQEYRKQHKAEYPVAAARDHGTTLPGGDAVIANDSIYYMLETAAKAAHGMLSTAFPTIFGALVCEKTSDIPNYPFRVGLDKNTTSLPPAPQPGEHRTLWIRLGCTMEVTAEEAEQLLSGGGDRSDTLTRIIQKGRFVPDGESYIPESVVAHYNKSHGTAFEEGDTEFDLNAGDFDFSK